MNDAFICDAIRTPFGRYGGSLSTVRADDLGALPIAALISRNKDVDWAERASTPSAPPPAPSRPAKRNW